MYIAPGQGQTAPRGQNFEYNRKALSLFPAFVASLKKISLKSDLYNFFYDLIHIYSPRAAGHTAPRGQSFDFNRTTFHFGHLLLVSEKSIVLPFSHTKA